MTVLAYLPSPSQGVWHLGPVPIRAYALCIILGIVAALIIGDRRWQARGGEGGVIYDIALWAVPFGLVGGRLYHVMTDWRTYFGPEGKGLGAAFQVWEGGLGIWGAVALGGVGAWIACRRRGIPLPAFGDAIAPGIVLAQAIGRIGNYFNQELYGRETTLPWGLEIYKRVNAYGVRDDLNGVSTGEVIRVVHPTFLYELLWNLLIFALLLWVDRRFKIGHGRLFALYVAGYCLGRFWVELMRSDMATHIAGVRINTFTSAFVLVGAVVYMMLAPKGREDPASLAGKRATDDSGKSSVDEMGKDLVAAAAGTGVVAAATAAGRDDVDDADHMHPGDISDDDGSEAAAAVELKAIVGDETSEQAEAESTDAVAEGDEASAEADTGSDETEPSEPEAAVAEQDEVGPDEAEPAAGTAVDVDSAEPDEGESVEADADEASAEVAGEEAESEPEAAGAGQAQAGSAAENDGATVDADAGSDGTEPEAEAEAAEIVEPVTAVAEQGETGFSEVAEPGSDAAVVEQGEPDPDDGEPLVDTVVDTEGAETEPEAADSDDADSAPGGEADVRELAADAQDNDPAAGVVSEESVDAEADAESVVEAEAEADSDAENDEPTVGADAGSNETEPSEPEADVTVEPEAEPDDGEPAAEVASEESAGEADVRTEAEGDTAQTPAGSPQPVVTPTTDMPPAGGRIRRWLRRRNR